MQADVVEAAQRAPVLHDDDRLVNDLGGDEAPRFGQVGHPPDQLPGAPEDLLLLERQIRRVDVEAGGEGLGEADVAIEREGHGVELGVVDDR